MTLIGLLIALVVFGLVLYLVELFIPMDATIKTAIRIVVGIIVLFWILQALGLLPAQFSGVRIR